MTEAWRDCPCCDAQKVFMGQSTYQICEICGWEDDPFQEQNPDVAGGANAAGLHQAKENVRKTGWSDPATKPLNAKRLP